MLFYPNKVIQALIKDLLRVQWSKEHQVIYLKNTPENLDKIFLKFRGVAWINRKYFFKNKPVNTYGVGNGDISWAKERVQAEQFRYTSPGRRHRLAKYPTTLRSSFD